MPRSYHVDIARYAINADQKWIDNLLSHFELPGVEGGRQGVARRISEIGIRHIALVRLLSRDVDVSLATAISLSQRLLSADPPMIAIADGLEIRLDRAVFERNVACRIADAVESIVPARRGRPPARSKSARADAGE